MPRRTKEEAQKTRAAIVLAAEKCFYERGVVRTSLQEIAQAAGVTRGAVYWHFRDKVELLNALADMVFLPHEALLAELLKRDLINPLEDLRVLALQTVKAFAHDNKRRRIFTILTKRCEYGEEMLPVVSRNQDCHMRVINRLTSLFERVQAKGMLAPSWSPQTASFAFKSLFVGFLFHEMEWPRPNPTRDRHYADAINSFFSSMKTASAPSS